MKPRHWNIYRGTLAFYDGPGTWLATGLKCKDRREATRMAKGYATSPFFNPSGCPITLCADTVPVAVFNREGRVA